MVSSQPISFIAIRTHRLDQQKNGEPLTHDDLKFDTPEAELDFQRPS